MLSTAITASMAFGSAVMAQTYLTRFWLDMSQTGIAVISSDARPFPDWDVSTLRCEIINYGFTTTELTIAKSAQFDAKNRVFTRHAAGNRTEILVPGECVLVFEHYSEDYTLIYSISSERFLYARLGGDKVKIIPFPQYESYIARHTRDIFLVRRADAKLKTSLNADETVTLPQGRIVREREISIDANGTQIVLVECIEPNQCNTPIGWVEKNDLEPFKPAQIPYGPLPLYEVYPKRSIKGCGHAETSSSWEEITKDLNVGGELETATGIGAGLGVGVSRNRGQSLILTYPSNFQVEATVFVRQTYKQGTDGMLRWKTPVWLMEETRYYILQESTVNCDTVVSRGTTTQLSEGRNLPGPGYNKMSPNNSNEVSQFVRQISLDMNGHIPQAAIRFIVAEVASREDRH